MSSCQVYSLRSLLEMEKYFQMRPSTSIWSSTLKKFLEVDLEYLVDPGERNKISCYLYEPLP